MNYLELLENSYVIEKNRDGTQTRGQFMAMHIFNFTTYDDSMDELFGTWAIEVCRAITNGETFSYIEKQEKYILYLLMCNMPFFQDKLEWGASFRGAWWTSDEITLHSCGLWDGQKQLELISFTNEEWLEFMHAMIKFATKELT